MKTYYAKPSEVEREWVLIDAENQILGKVAVKAAQILHGNGAAQFRIAGINGDRIAPVFDVQACNIGFGNTFHPHRLPDTGHGGIPHAATGQGLLSVGIGLVI